MSVPETQVCINLSFSLHSHPSSPPLRLTCKIVAENRMTTRDKSSCSRLHMHLSGEAEPQLHPSTRGIHARCNSHEQAFAIDAVEGC